MKHMTLLSALVLVILSTACRDRARVVANDNTLEPVIENTGTSGGPATTMPPSAQGADSLVLSLHRTPCFGPCPAYRVFIYENGLATYEGYGYMERMGHYRTQVDRTLMDALVMEAENHGFFEFEDVYDSPVTDLPSSILTVRRGNDTKKVTGRVGQPKAFQDLVQRVEDIVLPLDWKPVPQDH